VIERIAIKPETYRMHAFEEFKSKWRRQMKRTKLVRVVGPILLLTVMVGMFAEAGPASASPEYANIHLTNYPSYCMDVSGGNNVAGSQVWLTTCSSGKMIRFEFVVAPGIDNCQLSGTTCYEFVDSAATSLCINAPSSGTALELEACLSSPIGGFNQAAATSTFWLQGSNQYIMSGAWNEEVTAESATNDSPIYTIQGHFSYQYWNIESVS